MTTQRLGKYELKEELGHGGFATVYRAVHVSLQTEVALKFLNPALLEDKSARDRFFQEARVASRLEHPNIVPILDLNEVDEQVFIAMEYMPGGSLSEWAETKPPCDKILAVFSQIASALDYAHSHNALHRDVKPGNILLDAAGKAHLNDFGLVYVLGAPHLTRIGSVVGTAAYTSPEQAESKTLNGRSDQYSLGIVAYEQLCGQLPFQGDNATAITLMHITKKPPTPSSINPEIPAEVDSVLLKALEKLPENRYETCSQFIDALISAVQANDRRRFHGLLQKARAHIKAGEPEPAYELLVQARQLQPGHPELKELIEEVEETEKMLKTYEQAVKDWQTAQQKARFVLDLFPDYPDPQGVFTRLKMRKAPWRPPPIKEILIQAAAGLGMGLCGAFLLLFFAFLFITRLNG